MIINTDFLISINVNKKHIWTRFWMPYWEYIAYSFNYANWETVLLTSVDKIVFVWDKKDEFEKYLKKQKNEKTN